MRGLLQVAGLALDYVLGRHALADDSSTPWAQHWLSLLCQMHDRELPRRSRPSIDQVEFTRRLPPRVGHCWLVRIFLRRNTFIHEVVWVNLERDCLHPVLLRLLCQLVLEQTVFVEGKVVCSRVDGAFGAEAALSGVLGPRRGEARVVGRVANDALVFRVVYLALVDVI